MGKSCLFGCVLDVLFIFHTKSGAIKIMRMDQLIYHINSISVLNRTKFRNSQKNCPKAE